MNNKFKTGDKIIYINWNTQKHFTRNKDYSVFDGYPESEYCIIVKNDHGFLVTVDQDMFINIKQQRKLKLEKLQNA
jgi:hypothetical protein